ncbi:membrane protein [Flavisolibacter tropicus]|uniref:Membrane protein n=2 Tax=Flavisolibacter tropicus TaxID=1492898 RepID=A0A172U2V9_9BACT|nr:membrane protein [Flavisolibacter tropicus]
MQAQTATNNQTDKVTALLRVSGIVRDAESKQPLTGVTVMNNGKKVLGTTDADGNFSVSVAQGSTMIFLSVSFSPRYYSVTAEEKGINIFLERDAKQLDNVVVTALGINRKEKALGYAAQSLGAKDVSDARTNNWSSALSGKVAGLNLIAPGSGPVNSTRITLRGDGSMDPTLNQALVIVDGVPIQTGIQSSGVGNAYQAGSGNDVPVDFGNGIQDINPDDIESISVLKGPGATALYGSRAAGGAILITTKSGKSNNKGIGITVNSNYSINTVLKWPDYQYEYGQGTGTARNAAGQNYYSYGASADGANTGSTSSAFGPKFDGQMYYQYDPSLEGQGKERTLWRPYKDNIKGFGRTGFTLTNNIALEGGNDNGGMRASITHTKNEWIMPNTGFERLTVQGTANYKISDKLKVNTKLSFTNKKSDNLPATGYNNQSIAYFMIFQNPSIPLEWYRPVWKKGYENRQQIHPFSSFIDNPYLIAYEMTNAMNSNAFVGTMSFAYEINKKFDLMVRGGVNSNSEDREMRRPFNTANFLNGYYKQQNIAFLESNIDFLASYHDKFFSDLDLKVSAGGNAMSQTNRTLNAYVDGLVVPDVYKLTNGLAAPTIMVNDGNRKVNSLYGLSALSYKDKYFLDFTGRMDWWSTLPINSNSMFYPSVNGSAILSDIFALSRTISFAKLRASWAQAGFDATSPYMTQKYYEQSEFPGSATAPITLFAAKLKPQVQTSYETGLDLRFLKNRFRVDATVYRNFTANQILSIPIDPTTGYTRKVINAGKVRNQGVELLASSKNISNKNFTWSTTVTWSKNANRVMSLPDEIESDFLVINIGGNATQQTRVGGTTGDIYGFGFLRAPDGQIIYTKDGLPARPADVQYIGNAYPSWKGGIQNEFSYKDFRFSFLVDGQYGGIIYSQTHHKMTEQGKLEHTLRGREENYIIGDGVVDDGTGKFVPNTTKVLPSQYYADYYRRANVEANSFDASFLKLREARIEYNLPKKSLGNFFKQASIALYGRDLLLITDFPMFDPETAALNGSSIMPGVEMGQLPSSRTMGANLTLKF